MVRKRVLNHLRGAFTCMHAKLKHEAVGGSDFADDVWSQWANTAFV
jgi:hypothetical protein